MRIPKISSRDIDSVKEETIQIGAFVKPDMRDESWKEDEKSYDKMIKKIEKFVRGSLEYREYVTFLKEEIDMNQCSFFKGVARGEDAGISIEIHHSPLTLYDITSIVFNHLQINAVAPTPFDVADEVMRAHYEGMVGLVPLSLTVHELVHSGDIFVPVNKVFGDVKGFYQTYRDGFTEDHKQLLRENIRATKQLIEAHYAPSVLERKFVYLEVEGFELPRKVESSESNIA